MSKEIIIGRLILSKEVLLSYPGDEHRNPISFSHCIGVHKRCGCWVDIKNVAPKSNALVCRGCSLIVPIPIDVRTWDELATFMTKVMKDDQS